MKWLDNIKNNQEESRFEIEVDQHIAFAEYRLRKDAIIYPHTVVPEPIGGQGIGEALATFAMQYARDHNLKIKPYCPFIARFMKEHLDEYGDLLAEGFRLP